MSTEGYWEEIERKIIHEIKEKKLSSQDFNINAIDDNGVSLLHISCETGMTCLCKVLLENNADVNTADIYGRTPIMIAAYNKYQKIVDLLIIHEARLTEIDVYGFNVLAYAIYAGDLQMFKTISSRLGSDETYIMDTYLRRMSSLALAAALGNTEIAKHIITCNPDLVNVSVEMSGMTPLMLAICGNHTDVAELLINHGANLQLTSVAKLSSIGYAKKIEFPLLKLKIPSICIAGEDMIKIEKRKAHPLTPNLYISPIKKASSPGKRAVDWIKMTMKTKRSRSLENRSLENRRKENVDEDYSEDDNFLKSILQFSKMEQYWLLFKEQEVSFFRYVERYRGRRSTDEDSPMRLDWTVRHFLEKGKKLQCVVCCKEKKGKPLPVQTINFKTFLTMNEDDLISIGISKSSTRLKLLNIIEHYRKIFDSRR